MSKGEILNITELQEAQTRVDQIARELLAYEIGLDYMYLETSVDEIKNIFKMFGQISLKDVAIELMVKIDYMRGVADESRLYLAAAYQAAMGGGNSQREIVQQLKCRQRAAEELQKLSNAIEDVLKYEKRCESRKQQSRQIKHLRVITQEGKPEV
jgi:hypothetical protein